MLINSNILQLQNGKQKKKGSNFIVTILCRNIHNECNICLLFLITYNNNTYMQCTHKKIISKQVK